MYIHSFDPFIYPLKYPSVYLTTIYLFRDRRDRRRDDDRERTPTGYYGIRKVKIKSNGTTNKVLVAHHLLFIKIYQLG